MNIILPHTHFDADHLARVVEEMKVRGAPTIKAIDCGEYFVALEGAHRIRAAEVLGLVPEIEEIEYSETATTDDIVPGSYDDCWTIAEIVSDSYRSIMIRL